MAPKQFNDLSLGDFSFWNHLSAKIIHLRLNVPHSLKSANVEQELKTDFTTFYIMFQPS